MALGWSVGARLLRWLISTGITVAVFYALAGRWDLPWLWATAVVASLVTLPLTLTLDPDLARERRRPGPRGPQRRPPGYLGMLLGYPVIAVAIGSWWALIPGALCVLIVLRRTMLEDAYLLEHLPGYREYAAAGPNRLIPGVW